MASLTESLVGQGRQGLLARWHRPMVVVGALVLSAYFALRPSLYYLALPVAIGGLWLIYRHPSLGLAALIVSSLVVPFAIGTGTQTGLHLGFLLAPALLLVWLAQMWARRSYRLVPSRTTWPLVGLVLTASLSFVSGYLPWNAFAQLAPLRAQIGAWAIFVLSAGVFLLAANQISDMVWLKRLVGLFLSIGAVYIVGRALPGLGVVSRVLPEGASGSLFWIWLVALAGGQALFNQRLARKWRVSLAAVVAVTFYVALSGEERSWASGWLPALVAFALLVWLRWPRAGSALGLIALASGLVFFPTIERLLLADNLYSLTTRQVAFDIVLQVIKVNPLLGVGPANYYWYTPLYPILGWYVKFNSHNQYVDLVAQTGLLGLGFFLWFVVETGRLGWRLRNRFEDGFARAYVNSCLAGLVGTLVAGMLGDWFLPFVYNIGIAGFRASVLGWLFLGGLVALEEMARRQSTSQAT